MEDIVRLLVLDDLTYYNRSTLERVLGSPLEIIAEADNTSLLSAESVAVYTPEEELLTWIGMQQNFDLVILGNNLGAGLKKGSHIANKLKEKTIVVWGSYTDEETVPYQQQGFSHFSQRVNVEDEILRMISP